MPILDSFRASDFIEPDAIARPVVAYGVRFDSKGSELAPHQHRKAQIMLASRGVLACEAEGGVWIVPPGSALWVPGGVPHRVSAAGSVEGYSVFIEAQAFAALPAACCMMSVSPLLRELIVRCASYPAAVSYTHLHQVRGLFGRQPDVGLDDGAYQRAMGHAGQRARAGHADARHVELGAVVGRQFQLLQPQAGHFAQVVQVAADRGGQGRQVGADVGDRKGDTHSGAAQHGGHAARLARQPGIGQAGLGGGFEFPHRFDLGAGARPQFVCLALDAGEGAAGLLARHHLGDARGVKRGFDQVGGADDLGVHGYGRVRRGSQSCFRSGKGRTGSRPSQSRALSRIRSNRRPLGPATSDSSMTVPGWYSVSK